MIKKIILGIFTCVIALCVNVVARPEVRPEVRAEVKPEYMQDVAIDEVHFPDEQFRKKLKIYVDKNNDEILSREERENIYYLDLHGFTNGVSQTWYQDMEYMRPGYKSEDYIIKDKNKCVLLLDFTYDEENPQRRLADQVVDVRGIEYFFNLQEVKMDKYELVSGSFKNNANLKKIWIGCSETGQRGYGNIAEDFPVSQLTYMHLENVDADALDVKEIPKLQILRVILPEGSNRHLKTLNLTKNTKLEELELANIVPSQLDLRQNRKLKSVKVYSGKSKRESVDSIYYVPEKNQKCKITFAKKNQVKTFWYFTADKKIDITRLSKLEDFQTLKATKAKVKSSWIRKTFTKKKWGCAIKKSGKIVKKVKADKKKKYTRF